MQYAIIGGTNMEEPPIPYREETIATPYGDATVFFGTLDGGQRLIFLSRHGVKYHADPPDINYHANIYALHSLGVTHIIGLSSVGACDFSFKLGTVCLINDFLDFTKNRVLSFERAHRLALHTGMEDVCSPTLNDALERRILAHGLPYSGRAIYACTEGPRFETASEVRMFRMLGAQILGMTLVPEAPLAHDLGICYAGIGVVANYGTGMKSLVTDACIEQVTSNISERVFELCFEQMREAR